MINQIGGDMNTINDVKQWAAEQGIMLTARDMAQITAAQRAERDRLVEVIATSQTFADRFNREFPRLLAAIVAVGETIVTIAQTMIVSLGAPVILVLLLVVEHHRVVEGIKLFDSNPTFAGFAAFALVLLNLVLEFTVHHVEHKSGWMDRPRSQWSIRIWVKNTAYLIGLGDDWTPRQLSPATRYRRLLRLVTWTILALALFGSMRTVIESTNGRWYDAIVSIVVESDLAQITTWLAGLLFAAAAVISAQGLSRYVAILCVEILARVDERRAAADDPYAADVERAGATAAVAIVQARVQAQAEKQAEKQAKKRAAEPVGALPPDYGDEDETQEAAPVPLGSGR